MSKIEYCEACHMQDAGAKTRIPLEHTCGREVGAISANQQAREIAHSIMDKNSMNYRGAADHCKACEDKRAGIKHLVALQHTCGR